MFPIEHSYDDIPNIEKGVTVKRLTGGNALAQGYRVLMIIFLTLLLLNVTNAVISESPPLIDKIVFLREGELWIGGKDGCGQEQITETAGKIADYLFSESLEYLAYTRVIDYVSEPGLWDEEEEIPQRAVYSITVMELKTQRILKEIVPPDSTWYYLLNWLPENKLLFSESSGFDVGAFFIFDVKENTIKELDYHEGSRLLSADFHKGGSLMVYIDHLGFGEQFRANLYLVDRKTGDETLLISKKSILHPEIAWDKSKIAFLSLEYVGMEGFDNLWIYDINNDSLENLYREPARPKSAGSILSWSPDNSFMGMFFPDVALLIEIENPEIVHHIQGKDFQWIDHREIIFVQDNNVHIYYLETKERELLIKDATRPVFTKK